MQVRTGEPRDRCYMHGGALTGMLIHTYISAYHESAVVHVELLPLSGCQGCDSGPHCACCVASEPKPKQNMMIRHRVKGRHMQAPSHAAAHASLQAVRTVCCGWWCCPAHTRRQLCRQGAK